MKPTICIALLFCSLAISSQNLNDLLASGLGDAERFTTSYLTPVTEVAIYSVSNGWYNSAEAKPLRDF